MTEAVGSCTLTSGPKHQRKHQSERAVDEGTVDSD